MNLERRLADHVVVSDGAMGSELLARLPDAPRLDTAALEHPDQVLAIHLDYLAAGAEILQTATFGTSRPRLQRLYADTETEALNATAVKLAREAREVAGVDCLVAGSIGPLTGVFDPDSPEDRALMVSALAEQADILAGRGADLLVLESFFRLDELELAVAAVRGVTRLPIIALLTFPSERPPHPWAEHAALVARATELDVQAAGIGCAPGPLGALEILERIPEVSRPLAAQPNAGMVVYRPGSRLLSPATPQYLAQFARRAAALGAALVGGCCGTGPEHIRAISDAVAGLKPQHRRGPAVAVSEPPQPPKRREPSSSLATKLAEGRFVRVVQIDPPKGANSDRILEAARLMANHPRVDAVDINSNPLARLRMDSLWLAAEIERRTGIETMPHVTPRDAGIMGIEAQLLGAWRHGIRNLLAVSGDPSQLGDYPGQYDVNQVDIFELVRAITRLAEGSDWTGNPIGDPPAFNIGVAVNPNDDVEREAERLQRKVEAGARFAMSQVFFEWGPWERLLDRFGGRLPVPALAPIWPLGSHKLALRLHYEVPGIAVPAGLLADLEAAGAEAAEIGRRHAQAMLAEAPQRAQGVYIIAPFKSPEKILDLLE